MNYVQVIEGTTQFLIPWQDDAAHFPPGSAPVFFNRRMELNRDATILLLKELLPAEYLDLMAATGVRALRVANECEIPVIANDRDFEAIRFLKANAQRLGLPVRVVNRDANALLSTEKFEVVDLDPFGSPAPFIDSAVRSARKYLFVTATDTAPLCGAHLKAGMRRYAAVPMNTQYHPEVGLRMLIGHVAREMMKYDRGFEPLLSFSFEHFHRTHLAVVPGVRAADRTLASLGFIHQCPHCSFRSVEAGLVPSGRTCPGCSVALLPIGPLWIGDIADRELCLRLLERIPGVEFGSKARLSRLLRILAAELPVLPHYDYHKEAKRLGVSPPAMDILLERLVQKGYGASRAHYSGTAVLTDAPPEVLEEVLSL
ncbi:tRNA (guanine(10)-N(2))-dimethyltransferase [Methanocalculus taiwanensis]|uniref:tRNA (guanine(26)-N(2))-dimethyltransferase n=1 Tax=Methanocalculus taiwanensis TaxID=106207 RepID=A0ABD4THG3_9EURY|nr:tRNA (guanine(26)-N(2))-dimethyltransferase [Methanocalculus taiwanensis]MCQ1538392.1 tRNA (guanine(10)-N(2))-dimethyltransferase [Methanocalculus taiwanensis]